jgi:hypothetical protein
LPYPLNNAETLDTYDDNRTTLVPPRTVHAARIIIANAAAMVSLERCDTLRVGAGVMLPEEFWPPGVYGSVEREFPIGLIKFRSAVVGVPAQVSATVDPASG